MSQHPALDRYFDDPLQIYGFLMFLIRAKDEAEGANVIFDPHAGELGRLLSQRLQEMMDANHPRLARFPRQPLYFLTEVDPVYMSLCDRLFALLANDAIQRAIAGRELAGVLHDYFSPFRLSQEAMDKVRATAIERFHL
ncbi:MAG: hypothetical protein AB7F85_08285 [Hyphomonadaceae bacterium]